METKDKIVKICREHDIKRSALIEATGANKSTVSTWFNGVSKPAGIYLTKLSRFLHIDPEWLLDDRLDWTDRLVQQSSTPYYYAAAEQWEATEPVASYEVELPFYRSVEASAGFGFDNADQAEPKMLRFSKDTLTKLGIAAQNVVCIKVTGNSMEPVLPSGSTVGVDTSCSSIEDGKLYAIEHDGLLRIKIVYMITGSKIRLRSYNQEEYPDEVIDVTPPENIRIVGRVFWYSVII